MRPPPGSSRSRSLTQFLLGPLLTPLLLLLAVTAAVVWGIDRNARQIELLNTSQVRLNLINLLARDVIDLETGMRGYVLVSQDTFLEPYRRGQRDVSERLGKLQTLSVSAEQRRNLSRVQRTGAALGSGRGRSGHRGPARRRTGPGGAGNPADWRQATDRHRARRAGDFGAQRDAAARGGGQRQRQHPAPDPDADHRRTPQRPFC